MILFELTVILGYANILPFNAWHIGAGIGLILFMVTWAFIQRSTIWLPQKLGQPRQVDELWRKLRLLTTKNADLENQTQIRLVKTSLGLQISFGEKIYRRTVANSLYYF